MDAFDERGARRRRCRGSGDRCLHQGPRIPAHRSRPRRLRRSPGEVPARSRRADVAHRRRPGAVHGYRDDPSASARVSLPGAERKLRGLQGHRRPPLGAGALRHVAYRRRPCTLAVHRPRPGARMVPGARIDTARRLPVPRAARIASRHAGAVTAYRRRRRWMGMAAAHRRSRRSGNGRRRFAGARLQVVP